VTDLIWVGNTLLPRWFVFGFISVVSFLCVLAAITAYAWVADRWSKS